MAINSNDAEQYPDDRPERMVEQAGPGAGTSRTWSTPTRPRRLAYRAACTPDFFLFDAAGTLVYRGRFDGSTPGNNVPLTGDELDVGGAAPCSPATAISTDQRPSVGCSIKWKPGNEPGW